MENTQIRALGSSVCKELAAIYSDTVGKGTYQVRLDHKAWGKASSLWCYFTVVDPGAKEARLAVNCFRSRIDQKTYGPRDDSVDFSIKGNEGTVYEVDVTLSKSGFMNLKTAKVVS